MKSGEASFLCHDYRISDLKYQRHNNWCHTQSVESGLNHLVGTEKEQVGQKWGKSGADDEDELPIIFVFCVLVQ